ncbi:MAG: alanine--tRNA ligase [Candidatus Moranbacteria bacterium]|nr:alanine--tRNA ligase [Candidatus Moranbacteria bacterium]
MDASELRGKYLDFFASKKHSIIPSASLVPNETDASTLFTTAGMHPLVPYLLGTKHPGGTRVADIQKCVRTGDIEDVGDNRHLTFFEMMGNWSFGDYFKRESIEWSFEFLTGSEWLGLDRTRLYVTVFRGEDGIPRDDESIAVWKEVLGKAGLSGGVAGTDEVIDGDIRILPLGTDDNFWIAGATGPCGGDTEMFYDTRPDEGPLSGRFSDLVDSGRLMEVWNNVFMEFEKKADGSLVPLSQRNVDTGMGVERTLAMLEGKKTVFETSLFAPLFRTIAGLTGIENTGRDGWYMTLDDDGRRSARIVADHARAAVFMISDGILPSNTERGYVLRRIIRRMIRHGRALGIGEGMSGPLAETVIVQFADFYTELNTSREMILDELEKEEMKFRETLERGMKEFGKMIASGISGKEAFDLYQSYGFPFELTRELAKERGVEIDEQGFQTELKQHQELSRTASAGMFKGGLQDQDERTARLHTATHLLQAALREVLGSHVFQRGSNITPERLRFDFVHHAKLTPEEISRVQDIVNEAIREDVPVTYEEMTVDEAKSRGALGIFDAKYGDSVKVYSAGEFSKEICGGPHATHTGELGHFRIQKEEASSAGVRRIKAVLE